MSVYPVRHVLQIPRGRGGLASLRVPRLLWILKKKNAVYYVVTPSFILFCQLFDGIECEWPFFFLYLALDGECSRAWWIPQGAEKLFRLLCYVNPIYWLTWRTHEYIAVWSGWCGFKARNSKFGNWGHEMTTRHPCLASLSGYGNGWTWTRYSSQ